MQLKRLAANYLYYAAKPHALNPIHYARVVNDRKMDAHVRQHHPALYEVVREMAPTGSTGCSFSNYWELYSG